MSLMDDEGIKLNKQGPSQLKWDKKKKNFVKGGGIGSDNQKLIKTESGARLPATFKSGKFDEWKQKNKIDLPRTGEDEDNGKGSGTRALNNLPFTGGKKFRHNKITEAKPLDKKDKNYEKKLSKSKKSEGQANDNGRRAGNINEKKNQLKSADAIRKTRQLAAKRKEKNARAPRKNRK